MYPDIKARIKLNESRKGPVYSGYRPAHKIKNNYLTTGQHQYIGTDKLMPGEETLGTITVISPEHYPQTLTVGQRIEFSEGRTIVGEALVIDIYNELLKKNSSNQAKN